jgi:hypothetical protein
MNEIKICHEDGKQLHAIHCRQFDKINDAMIPIQDDAYKLGYWRATTEQQRRIAELENTADMYAADFDSLLDLAWQCCTTKKAKALLAEFISNTESQHNAEQWQLKQQDMGIDRCIEELQDCYRVAIDENNDIDAANSIEILIDHIQQLKAGDQ